MDVRELVVAGGTMDIGQFQATVAQVSPGPRVIFVWSLSGCNHMLHVS